MCDVTDACPSIANENPVDDGLKARRKYRSIVSCRRDSAGKNIVDVWPLLMKVGR